LKEAGVEMIPADGNADIAMSNLSSLPHFHRRLALPAKRIQNPDLREVLVAGFTKNPA